MTNGSRSVGFTFYGKDLFKPVAQSVAASMEKVERSAKVASRAGKEQSKTVEMMERGWSKLGRSIAGAVAAYASVSTFKAVLTEASTVEDAINKVMSLIREPADQAKYRATIEQIIRDNQRLGRSAGEIGEALFMQVSQVGASEKAFADFGESVKLAIGGFAALPTAVTGINKILENYPKLQGNAALAANILNAAQRSGSTNVEQLASSLPDVLGIASSQGISAEEAAATVAILSKSLGSTSQATTATRGLILALTQPEKGAREALARVGIKATPQEVAKIGWVAQLEKLGAVLQKRPDLAKLLVPNTEGLSGAAKLDPATIARIQQVATEARADYETGLGLQQSFERVQGSASAEVAKTNEAFKEVGATIGTALLPALKDFAQYLRDANLPRGPELDRALGVTPGMASGDIVRRIVESGRGRPAGAGVLDPGARPRE